MRRDRTRDTTSGQGFFYRMFRRGVRKWRKEREILAQKKTYPGGFRLTLATARRLAVQEFGTAKGLEPDRGADLEGFFTMRMGNMGITISPVLGMSGCTVVRAGLCTASHTCIGYFNRETLELDCDVMDKYERQEKREALEQWVFGGGPEPCHKLIDEVWNAQ